MPDRTLMFDIERETAKARMAQGAPLDRLELEKEDFFTRVSRAYDRIAQAEPERIVRIDSGRSIEEVFEDVLAAVNL
jgi:dTMP kinase